MHHMHVVAAHHHVARAMMAHAGFGARDGKREERSRENGEGGDFHVGTLEARTGFVCCASGSTLRAIRCCALGRSLCSVKTTLVDAAASPPRAESYKVPVRPSARVTSAQQDARCDGCRASRRSVELRRTPLRRAAMTQGVIDIFPSPRNSGILSQMLNLSMRCLPRSHMQNFTKIGSRLLANGCKSFAKANWADTCFLIHASGLMRDGSPLPLGGLFVSM